MHGEKLFELKRARMSASAFAFLRGSAPLFYDLVGAEPALAGDGPTGWLVGDLHLENFGAFRTGKDDDVVFDVNDFDDAGVGPRRLDLLRLATSVLLAAPLLGRRGPAALELTEALVRGYATESSPKPPTPVARLLERVRRRTRGELLAHRTAFRRGERRFILGARYLPLPERLRARAERAFGAYLEAAGVDPRDEAFAVRDVAFRVAGTGSLGALRIAVLTRGKGGRDGHWLFDLKEERRSSLALLGLRAKRRHVIEAMHACLPKPPISLGRTALEGVPLVGRRLAPQEDKLALATLPTDELGALVPWLGGVVARMHARSGEPLHLRRRERTRLLDDAVALAGLHEAVYLAFVAQANR